MPEDAFIGETILATSLLGAMGTWAAGKTIQNNMNNHPASPSEEHQDAGNGSNDLSSQSADCGTGSCDDDNKEKQKNKWRGRGKDYEDHVRNELNATDNFRAEGREFDGSFVDSNGQTTWYDAKSSWDYTDSDAGLQSFKSTTGQQASIAANNGASLSIVTPVDPPENVQSFLDSRGISVTKVP